MTLNEIIAASLGMLDRGTDAQTIEFYSTKFTAYANSAIKRIAEAYRPERTDTVESDSGFDLSSLKRSCVVVKSVRQNGRNVRWGHAELDRMWCDASGEVEVTYIFYPAPLVNATDRPELPEAVHRLIPEYVAARQLGSDPNAAIHYQEFNAGLLRLPPSKRGEPYRFTNQWG